MGLLQLVGVLHDFTLEHPVQIIVKHLDTIFVAINGQVSTTKVSEDLEESWRVTTAAHAAVWLIQNPDKSFEAATTSLVAN